MCAMCPPEEDSMKHLPITFLGKEPPWSAVSACAREWARGPLLLGSWWETCLEMEVIGVKMRPASLS
jgi:hypothetical protein